MDKFPGSKFWEPPKALETDVINGYVEKYGRADWYMWAIVYEDELVGLVCE